MAALGLDFLTHVVNVNWGKPPEQGLLAEYPPGPGAPEFESVGSVMGGNPTAYALESGRSFDGVNMGASGVGHTVLTRGLVCFGKPRDGAACFMACPEYSYFGGEGSDALQRGFLNEGNVLTWAGAGGGALGKLVALTFAVDAFFAVYTTIDEDIFTTTIATSFDGLTWTSSSAFPSTGVSIGAAHGGAVAGVLKKETNLEGEVVELPIYVSAGDIGQDDSNIRNFVSNLMWATSRGLDWSSSSNEGAFAEPGVWYNLIFNYSHTVAAGPISADKQIFVAAAATKTNIANPIDPDFPYAQLTAAAAVSETGDTWDTIAMPGALPGGLFQDSFGLAVTFVRSQEDGTDPGGSTKTGYFLMSDHEFITGEGHAIAHSSLYKSSDGRSWSKIRSNENWMATLSTIARDLDKTTIVHI